MACQERRDEVGDDGLGLPAHHRAGVGRTSMRERASELGGHFTITTSPRGGTFISVELPIPGDP